MCSDPMLTPVGYNRTPEGWRCAAGYTGLVVKDCGSADRCSAEPSLSGCARPLPCDVLPFVDVDPRPGVVGGALLFGPAQGELGEEGVEGYLAFLADACGAPLGAPLAAAPAGGLPAAGCCRADLYRLELAPAALPPGAARLAVVASAGGRWAPEAARAVALEDFVGGGEPALQPVGLVGGSPGARPGAWALGLLLALLRRRP